MIRCGRLDVPGLGSQPESMRLQKWLIPFLGVLSLGCLAAPQCTYTTTPSPSPEAWFGELPVKRQTFLNLGGAFRRGTPPEWSRVNAVFDPPTTEGLAGSGPCPPELARRALAAAWPGPLQALNSDPTLPQYRIQCRLVSAKISTRLGMELIGPIPLKTTVVRAELWFRVVEGATGRVVCSYWASAWWYRGGSLSAIESERLLQVAMEQEFWRIGEWVGLLPNPAPVFPL